MPVKKSNKLQVLWLTLAIAFVAFLTLRKKTPEQKILSAISSGRYSAYKRYILAVAKLETGNFTSRLFNQYNNAFGMNCVQKRDTTQTGCTATIFDGKMSKGIYSSPESSARDFLLWLAYNNAPDMFDSNQFRTIEDFNDFLYSKGFYGVSKETYLTGLKKWM